jgi:hypothetical protein
MVYKVLPTLNKYYKEGNRHHRVDPTVIQAANRRFLRSRIRFRLGTCSEIDHQYECVYLTLFHLLGDVGDRSGIAAWPD